MRLFYLISYVLFTSVALASKSEGDALSAYVPPGHELVISAEFEDANETFTPEHPLFTTAHARLNSEGDLNTVRRLGRNRELQLFLDGEFSYEGERLGIDPFSVSGGILTITADRLPARAAEKLAPLETATVPAPLYSSGLLSTETEGRGGKGYTQLYGYWELRARLPKGKGLWPAFWLVTETHDYWDEVDIFEVLGHRPTEVFHSTHFHDGGGTEGLSWDERISTTVDTSDGFHVYGMWITETELIYSIDGRETLRVGHTLEVPLYTLINLAVGGDWPGSPDETTQFPARMEIDYLRIYRPK